MPPLVTLWSWGTQVWRERWRKPLLKLSQHLGPFVPRFELPGVLFGTWVRSFSLVCMVPPCRPGQNGLAGQRRLGCFSLLQDVRRRGSPHGQEAAWPASWALIRNNLSRFTLVLQVMGPPAWHTVTEPTPKPRCPWSIFLYLYYVSLFVVNITHRCLCWWVLRVCLLH